ncbi:hypothetical protein FRC00_001892 [Tulasnella sp. 408]|nr:hypothetical protein FRC00_001892 [Tulasnella sp. 408]
MRYSEEESNWTFVSNLDQANWSRFHTYARRIRIIKIGYTTKRWSKPVSMGSVEIAQVSVPSGYHFPRPVRLWYAGIGLDHHNPDLVILSLRNFLSVVSTSIKTLHTFDNSFIDGDSDDSVVQTLFRRFTELEEASLESVYLNLPFYQSNSPAVPNLVTRHTSTIFSLELCLMYTEQLWAAVRGLHNLKEFSIDLQFACSSPSSPRDTITALDDITSSIFPRLQAFTVKLPFTDVATEQRRLEVFKCISRLTQLTRLKIRSGTPIMLYADELGHVGQSLRRLETLGMDACLWGDNQTFGTSSSLISILRSFPHLKRLETCFICDSIPDLAPTKAHPSLEILDLTFSPAPKVRKEEVVGFLKSILPGTARVVHPGVKMMIGHGTGETVWGEIIRLMDMDE